MFRKLTSDIMVSPQIGVDAVAEAKGLGVTLIINNRPEGESDDQVSGAEIEAVARAAGLDYVAIPITHAGFSKPQVDAMLAAVSRPDAKILAYCRSGTRSTLVWALAQSAAGEDGDALAALAANAGYDLSPIRPIMDQLRAHAG